jgi:hypothetical protein
VGSRRAVKPKLRVVKKRERYKKDENIFAAVLLDLRLRQYYTTDKLPLQDLLATLKKQKAAMIERVAKRRRLRLFSIDGNIPPESRPPAKRVVLA